VLDHACSHKTSPTWPSEQSTKIRFIVHLVSTFVCFSCHLYWIMTGINWIVGLGDCLLSNVDRQAVCCLSSQGLAVGLHEQIDSLQQVRVNTYEV